MLKVQEIRELIRLVDQSSIDEFTYETEGVKLIMKKNNDAKEGAESQYKILENPVTLPAEKESPVEEVQTQTTKPGAEEVKTTESENTQYHEIISPMVGTFYAAPAPDAEPYVKIGSKVSSDTIVCIVEAMKLFNEIEAEVNGEIVDILVKNGQLVEYGQPLFLVKAD